MVIDMRYHIASLAAVFIALGIGIMTGSLMNGSEFIDMQQQKLISVLEKDVIKMIEERESLTQQITEFKEQEQYYSSVIKHLAPVLIGGLLEEKVIDIVFINSEIDNNMVNSIKEYLHLSGADTGQILAIRNDINSELTMDELKKGPHGMIIIASNVSEEFPSKSMEAKEALLDSIKYHDVQIVAGEKVDNGDSFMPFYANQGIPTVDNINNDVGMLALIYTLSGIEGNFGVKELASSLLPEIALIQEIQRGSQGNK